MTLINNLQKGKAMQFESFENQDDFFDAIRKNRSAGIKAYNEMPQEIKDALCPGSFYVMDAGYDFLIFGEIIESKYEEDRESLKREPWLRLVQAISVACQGTPDVGTEFACNMFPIQEKMYRLFEKFGWSTDLNENQKLEFMINIPIDDKTPELEMKYAYGISLILKFVLHNS